MEQKEIIEGNKLIAELLGWYYIGFNDLKGHPKPGWYRIVSGINMLRLQKTNSLHRSGGIWVQHVFRKHSDLRFFNSWDELMKVMEFIQEKVDLKEFFYNYKMGGETEYNFEGFEFCLYQNGGYSGVNLMLDPQMEIAKSFDPKLTWLQNMWVVVRDTVVYINYRRNQSETEI